MKKHRILYNPLTNATDAKSAAVIKEEFPADDEFVFEDVTKIEDIYSYLTALDKDEQVILAGGDGTLNYFINGLDGRKVDLELCYYPMGSGNDFYSDVQEGSKPIGLNKYIENLPTVTVKGKSFRFINGVGFGIDGYCCETGDKQRAEGKKKINYAGIAIKGMLSEFKPLNATITVDGVEHKFEHVWLAPSMNGRYYGGGMIIAPDQDRLSEKKEISVVVLHCKSKLKTLMIFPGIFKGKHVENKKTTAVFTGKEITVTFDKPTALQIDGETISGVVTYTANAAE